MMPEPPDWLAASFADRAFSRNERKAARAVLAGSNGPEARDEARRRAFALVRDALSAGPDRAALDWLEGVVDYLQPEPEARVETLAEAHFSPGLDCPRTIVRLLDSARTSLDLCVFTITDDGLSEAVVAASRRGVAIRIVTDNDKAGDLGSDVEMFEAAGIPVRVDRSPYHMHHKFALADGARLLTGSYNWTRGAARDNLENLIVVDDPRLVGPFVATFERIWADLA